MLLLDDIDRLAGSSLILEQVFVLSLVEVASHVVLCVLDGSFAQAVFEYLAAVDFVLHCVDGDEAVDDNISLLANAVASVD